MSKTADNQPKEKSSLISERRFAALKLFAIREKFFLGIIIALLLIAGVCYPYPQVAMWLGFAVAGYSVVANDSIQTIGTFLVSNKNTKWWILWIFIGGIFLATVTYSWVVYSGDVSFQRLSSKGFSEAPTEYYFLQVAAPIILLLLTRLRMPVSTTFMLLSVFSTSAEGVSKVAGKSFMGYVISFATAFLVWYLLQKPLQKLNKGEAKPYWKVLQWGISGTLWCMWIMHDAANVAIFLPRSLGVFEFLAFALTIFIGLGVLFYMRGDKMQEIVNEKTEVTDVRAATIVDLVYALILFLFKNISTIPMSTTWVFIGLLGGRELAIALAKRKQGLSIEKGRAGRIIGKDVALAGTGLIISVILALGANPTLAQEIMGYFK